MDDSETEYVVELQSRLARRLRDLGFGDEAHGSILAHDLAEIAARSRTVEQQALPLFLSLDHQHLRSLAEVTVALKNHLDAMEDSISDVRESLGVLVDFLLRESESEGKD
ncbi:MAG: hypothetical protein WA655_21500 [Candidatus Korobacteraceae bacterium]